MDPRFYTIKATAPLRARFHEWKNTKGRTLYSKLVRNRGKLLWYGYLIVAFLMFGYEMNHFVGQFAGKPDVILTIVGSALMACGWPLVLVTWVFAHV